MLLLRSSVTLSSLFLLSAIVDDTLAFSSSKSSQLIRSSSTCSTSSPSALNVGAVWTDDINNDIYLMNRAEACANSESCGLEEASAFLDDILHQQKECIGAGVLSTKATICDNVDVTAEIVANLRAKIELQRRQVAPVKAAVHVLNVMLGVYVISTILHGVAVVPNVPVDSPLYTDFLSSSLMEEASSTRGVVSFLPQEFFWAARDGYLPSLMTEFFKNGGLVVDTSAFDTKVVAFTPQEWVWSIQNGSFGTILQENMKYGGLVVDSSYQTDTVPMTLQDALWSVQGGYAGTAAQHFFRNGGV